MRRILIAATILAAGCGGKRTIPATPEIKAAATQWLKDKTRPPR